MDNDFRYSCHTKVLGIWFRAFYISLENDKCSSYGSEKLIQCNIYTQTHTYMMNASLTEQQYLQKDHNYEIYNILKDAYCQNRLVKYSQTQYGVTQEEKVS